MAKTEENPTSLGGRYELVMELASGGMGRVYVGRQRGAAGFERFVAIKRMHQHIAQSPEQVAAFLDEARLASSIRHPNVVGVHDVHEFGGEIVMVMDYVDGVSLSALFKRLASQGQALPAGVALRILVDALHGLHAAHEQRDVMGRALNIVHRDATPHNILVAEDGSVRITDFGIAKATERSAHTATGLAKGKLAYMAPEQLAATDVDRRADVFAIGLTALELLSGQRAFGQAADLSAMMQIASGEIPRLRERRPDLPEHLDAILTRATAFDRENRFATALELADALERSQPLASRQDVGATVQALFGEELEARRARLRGVLLGTGTLPPVSGAPDSLGHSGTIGGLVPTSAPRPARRRTWLMAALVGVFLVLAVGFLTAAWKLGAQERERSLAASAPASASAAPVAPPSCPPGMLLVAAGKFFMGSAEPQASASEGPVAHVAMSAFCIDRSEVSVAEYQRCSEVGECQRATRAVDWPRITDAERLAYVDACNGPREDRGDHPINCVDWAMAQQYCSHRGRRLPTEAEWEYAARGPDGRLYPWGDTLPTPARVNACGQECAGWAKDSGVELVPLDGHRDEFSGTAPVVSFDAGRSPYGAYHLTGNAWEWTASWFAPYDAAPKQDPRGPPGGERKVIRGGGWNSGEPGWLRASFRFPQLPSARHPAIGFRCAAAKLGP